MADQILKVTFSNSGAPGGGVGVNSISFNEALNNFPTTRFGAFPSSGSTTVAPPPLAQAMTLGGQAQQAAGNGIVNIRNNLTDGVGGSIQFSGLHTAPQYDIGTGSISISFGGVHEASLVSNLNMSIYAPDDWSALSAIAVEAKGPVTERLKIMLQAIVESWQQRVSAGDFSDAVKASMELIHQSNSRPYEILIQILDASAETAIIENLDDALSTNTDINDNFNQYLARLAITRATNYWSVVQSFCAAFGLVYVPNLQTGNMGKLASYSYIWDNEETMDLDTKSITVNLGSIVVAPVSHVAMYGASSGIKWKLDGDSKVLPNENAEVIVRYPDNPEGGRPFLIPLPDFISSSIPRPVVSPKDFGSRSSTAQIAVDAEALEAAFGDRFNQIKKICTAIARQTFLDVSLADSTISVTIPLDLTVHCGKMVSVIDAETGGNLFRGLVRSVTHDASTVPSAGTALSFSHVQAGSFTLK